ncbi:MAG: YbdK family carboxylate-amine ligase [Gammaproteobacteria bacterium]|nr:YbdK family carboxylate-amine ligase [Gammaproteobacteria bacterium]MYG68203.1 YbdK family carboxylate-amine ligase [Gammaproteobacteria bacterium]
MTEITLGIEEELMIVDPGSRDVVPEPDGQVLVQASEQAGENKVVSEFLRSQVETNSRVCASIAEVEQSLRETRRCVIDAARAYGARIIASSTHPWARWQDQKVTEKDRYRRAEILMQDSVRQFFIGGMHIHAGFGDDDRRIEVMHALRGYLAVFLVLSCSSPFHGGRLTGLKSYRQMAITALPRTGTPPAMRTRNDYDTVLERYLAIEAIEDGSELRWDIRPSASYPTIELRICDICPRIEDAVSIAALYACLIRHLDARLESGERLESIPPESIEEGRWLAQRYGTFAFLPHWKGAGGRIDVEDLVIELVDMLRDDADALGCETALARIPSIISEGNSADRQEDVYRQAILDGANNREALQKVVDLVIAETEPGPAASAGQDI